VWPVPVLAADGPQHGRAVASAEAFEVIELKENVDQGPQKGDKLIKSVGVRAEPA
jgi:hypothetical protein